ncbi:MAG: VWA domain-containing protein [Sulfurovum sp.]|nr:VWA domain-containing protein [Sulfurovum sp.]
MKKGILQIIGSGMIAFAVIGCGGGGTPDTPDSNTDTTKLGNLKYVTPSGVTAKKLTGGTEGAALSAKSGKISGLVIVQGSSSSPKMMKAINMNPAKSARIAGSGINDIYAGLNADTNTDSIALQSSQSFQNPYVFTVSDYRVIINNAMTPAALSQQILGYIDANATGYPVADPSAPSTTDLRALILYGSYQGSDVYLVAVVPQAEYAVLRITVNAIINAASFIPNNATLQSKTETFTTGTGSSKMDFLFVVDDSGSMGDDQDALAKAAEDFTREMSSAGVNYRSAIVTTSSGIEDSMNGDANRILREVGIIENNETRLKEKLVAGTSGSTTETGIWNAEQALQSTGSATALGMPQTAADLAVIIISDEPSQYTDRSGGVDFNVSSNLFVTRGITVYGIFENLSPWDSTTGNLDDYNRSQYDDLVDVTGGIYADIKSTDSNGDLDFSNIMQKIASDAGGIASQFTLMNWATVVTEVKVGGSIIVANATNGYSYNQANKSIVFYGTAIPVANSTVTVKYQYYQY